MKAFKLFILFVMSMLFIAPALLASSISGTVFDSSTGKPIVGATVGLKPVNPIMSMAYSAKTDINGEFKMGDIFDGEYYIYAYCLGFKSPDVLQTVKLSNTNLAGFIIKLFPVANTPVSVSGHVWANEYFPYAKLTPTIMKPVYPAKITLSFIDPAGSELTSYSVTNSTDGSYLIKDVKPGIYILKCEADSFQPNIIKNFVVNQNPMIYDIYMAKIFTSSISGEVKFDNTGLPVAKAQINIYQAQGSGYGVTVYTDQDGKYKAGVPSGQYIISCTRTDPGYYYTEYYDNMHSFAEAKIIEVGKDAAVSGINFGLPDIKTEFTAKIKGMVKDDKGTPLPYAVVKLWFHFNKNVSTFAADSIGNSFAVKADANGAYEIVFKKDLSMLNEIVLSAEKEKYIPEFYKNKPYYYLADKIFIANDTLLDGIDFSLAPASGSTLYSISGVISGSTGTPINGAFVIASSTQNGEMSFAITDIEGKYNMSGLRNSKYFILFAATGYIPEYYNKAYLWEKAVPVYVNGPVTGINAALNELTSGKGSCGIAGTVTAGSGTSVSGALVTLSDLSGKAVSSAMTDGNGSYQIANLSDGNYILQVSKVNYQSVSLNVNVHSELSAIQVTNITMTQSATAVEEKKKSVLPEKNSLIGNYPNPFNPSTIISFSLATPEYTTLSVYNLLGQQVAVLISERLQAGIYNAEFDAKGMPSGIYICEMKAGSYMSLKKMLLVK